MRIGIFAHFGGKEYFTDGQTVKGKSLYAGLQKYASDVKIDIVDTYYLRHNRFRFICDFIKMIVLDRKIIFLPAHDARRVLFHGFYLVKIFLRKKIYHDCIAGSLDKELTEHPNWVKYLNSFESNWMESPQQVEKLKKMGVKNVVYIPNFKQIQPVSIDFINNYKCSTPFRFVIFSRVEAMKGIDDALDAIRRVNEMKSAIVATLDIYGPVQPGSEGWFDETLKNNTDICSYKGVCDPNESVDTLKEYFALLFPTRYYTEGMPGTIIDAMFAALPVIARRWAWCDNMISSGANGISYDFNEPEKLFDILVQVVSNPDIVLSMKSQCLQEAKKYREDSVMSQILKLLDFDEL